MENLTSLKNIYAELKRIARNEVLNEITQEAIKNKDFDTLEKIQSIKEDTAQG